MLRVCLEDSRTNLHPMRSLIFIATIALIVGTGDLPAADELPLRNVNSRQQIVVLNNGNVVKGQFTRRTGGVDVALNPGRMFIAEGQIRFQATSMEDAYLKMRSSIQDLTPTNHIELSRWCSANKLPTFARKELLDALFLNPEHETARLMLESLTRDETRAAQRRKNAARKEADERIANGITMRNILPDRRSLGGLPAPLAVSFTRRIQPLLSNKCGNGRCHSAGRNGFPIVSIRNGSSAVIAEQNLATVLGQIDAANPGQSPLLKVTEGLHGGSRTSLFPGSTGRNQLNMLRAWISGVAAEIGGHPSASAQSSPSKTIAQTAFQSEETLLEQPIGGGLQTAAHATQRDRDLRAQQMNTEAVIATRHDEFDPDVFNRRFHGRSNSQRPFAGTPLRTQFGSNGIGN